MWASNVDHPCTTYDVFYRAEMGYDEYGPSMDFIKPILYHDIAGPRTRSMFLTPFGRTLLREAFARTVTRPLLHPPRATTNRKEPKLADLEPRKDSVPTTSTAKTKRCVDAVAKPRQNLFRHRHRYTGQQQTFASNPEGVYQSIRRAFDAGAAGVLISHEYDEMRLPNLRAVGRAMAELPKG